MITPTQRAALFEQVDCVLRQACDADGGADRLRCIKAHDALEALSDALNEADVLLNEATEVLNPFMQDEGTYNPVEGCFLIPFKAGMRARILAVQLAERSKKPTPIRVCSSCGKSFQTDSLNYHFYCKECKP